VVCARPVKEIVQLEAQDFEQRANAPVMNARESLRLAHATRGFGTYYRTSTARRVSTATPSTIRRM
jgi:hypothetical protein